MILKDEADRNFKAMPSTPVKTCTRACTQHFSIFMDHPSIDPDGNNSELEEDADDANEIDSDPVVNSGETLEMLVFSKSMMPKTMCYVVFRFFQLM